MDIQTKTKLSTAKIQLESITKFWQQCKKTDMVG